MSEQRLHMSIDSWLEKLDLLVYRSIFKEYQAVEEILWITERDLNNLGIRNSSHRARVASSLAILKDKYEKNSRENRNYLSPHASNPKHQRTKSNTSISPINQRYLEDSSSGVRSWPTTKPPTSHNTSQSSPRSNIETYVGTEATAEDLKKALEKELSLDSSDLRSHAWYHGTILRQRAEELVTHDGNFLVRDCISQPGDFVITCRWRNLPLHFIIKKVILQPDTVYEKIQYCFEKESFDSIPDFVTYYVGSKCPLSVASGVIISYPVNRVMPLSYYASRYGIQCQIHYVAKALEKLPPTPEVPDSSLKQNGSSSPHSPKQLQVSFEADTKVPGTIGPSTKSKNMYNHTTNLIRMGSDPTLSPNTQRRSLHNRPNSGVFNSDALASLVVENVDKPPPKPSRVPSKKLVQRPFTVRKERKLSDHVDTDFVPISQPSLAHPHFQRQSSETRFSFLDRPSVSSCSSTPETESALFTLPTLSEASSFDPQNFSSSILPAENPPLQASVLADVRQMLLSSTAKSLGCHLTHMDLKTTKQFEDVDLGLGVTSGLELLLLPQGEQMQKDLFERTESMKIFVAVSILTTPNEEERVWILNRWIEIAIETKTALGNFFGFTSIMMGLTLPEILGLQSTWFALRHHCTENAFVFETKLRPTLKALHSNSGLEAPNTCLPYVLSLILILQQHISVMNLMKEESVDSETVKNEVMNFNLPEVSSTSDYGLELLANHLELGRNMMQQVPVFKKNGEMTLKCFKFEDAILDIFDTNFHLRLLWGFRGSVVCTAQRHEIFKKVVHSLYNKCIMNQ